MTASMVHRLNSSSEEKHVNLVDRKIYKPSYGMCDIWTETSANNAMPGRAIQCIEFLRCEKKSGIKIRISFKSMKNVLLQSAKYSTPFEVLSSITLRTSFLSQTNETRSKLQNWRTWLTFYPPCPQLCFTNINTRKNQTNISCQGGVAHQNVILVLLWDNLTLPGFEYYFWVKK